VLQPLTLKDPEHNLDAR